MWICPCGATLADDETSCCVCQDEGPPEKKELHEITKDILKRKVEG